MDDGSVYDFELALFFFFLICTPGECPFGTLSSKLLALSVSFKGS